MTPSTVTPTIVPATTVPATTVPATTEIDQLKKQNALLLRTLMRVQRERDVLRTADRRDPDAGNSTGVSRR